MADSLIGYLNQQIQKTHRPQQQQQQSSASTTTNVTQSNTFTISGGPPKSNTQQSVFTTLEETHVNPIQSRNIHPTPSATSDCVSSRGGLGISRIPTGRNNITVSTTATTATGNGASIGRNFPYSSSSIFERGGSMLLQHQPQFAVQPQSSIAVTTTQPHKQINMSSSGIPVALILPYRYLLFYSIRKYYDSNATYI